MESSLFKCPYCPSEYKSYTGLSLHARKTHKMEAAQLQVDYYYNGVWPTCECGCGEKLEFGTSTPSKFAKYREHHHQKVRGGFWTKEGLEKSAETRREKFAAGEIIPYNKGKKESELYSDEIIAKRHAANQSEARREKISKALKGKKKSPEQKERLAKISREYWSVLDNREAQRFRRIDNMTHTAYKKQSNIEKTFANLLDTLSIQYDVQYPVNGFLYDFYVESNNLLIEVDGDWWHCNEATGFEPIYESQKRTVANDKIKNKVAADHNYILLRFWESDIKNNTMQVVETLIKHIKKQP